MNFVFPLLEFVISGLYFICGRMLLYFNYVLVVKILETFCYFITKIKIVWFWRRWQK